MSDRVFIDADVVTGDKDHFGRYFGQAIKGVVILRHSVYLAAWAAGIPSERDTR